VFRGSTPRLRVSVFLHWSLRFHCGARTAIFCAMSAILNTEGFVAIEQAVKASTAPAEI
jgi:hypothetical protein